MGIKKEVCDYIANKNPRRFKFLRDSVYLKIKYYSVFNVKLDLTNPKTFNEKLQWLKLYDRKNEYAQMVDKFEMKSYVSSVVGMKYIVPTLGVYSNFDEIDFSVIPNQFVLKCTHDSGGVVVCKSKRDFDFLEAKRKIEQSLSINYYWSAREWPYRMVKPRIIIEKYLNNNNSSLDDYKVHCFNGKAKFILVCKNRFSKTGLTEDFYSIDWVKMDLRRPNHPNSEVEVLKPKQLGEMIEVAEKLSEKIPFLRVDFYIVDNHLYVGELTFFPASGFEHFCPSKYDFIIGNWLELPNN